MILRMAIFYSSSGTSHQISGRGRQVHELRGGAARRHPRASGRRDGAGLVPDHGRAPVHRVPPRTLVARQHRHFRRRRRLAAGVDGRGHVARVCRRNRGSGSGPLG